MLLVFFWFDFLFGKFFRNRAFSGINDGEYPQSIKARNKGQIAEGKGLITFLVGRILLFVAHFKSPVPATVGKNLASIFYFYTQDHT